MSKRVRTRMSLSSPTITSDGISSLHRTCAEKHAETLRKESEWIGGLHGVAH
jgi:hypothetical protein